MFPAVNIRSSNEFVCFEAEIMTDPVLTEESNISFRSTAPNNKKALTANKVTVNDFD